MSFTLSDARLALQDSARNAGVSGAFNNDPYSPGQGDRAIRRAINHFARETHCIQSTAIATLPSGTNAFAFSIADFEPERWLRIWPVPQTTPVHTCDIDVVEYEWIITQRSICTRTGAPRKLAFATTKTDAITLETSDQAYAIYIKYWTLLTAFTAGTALGTTVLNIQADMAEEVLSTYGVIMLQENQPAQLKEGTLQRLQTRYDTYLASKRGSGNMGARSIRRKTLSEIRAEGR